MYARGLGLSAGFLEPFFADSVTANLRGHLTRQRHVRGHRRILEWTSSGSDRAANDYDSFQATHPSRMDRQARPHRRVRQLLSIYGYEFDETADVADADTASGQSPRRRVGLIFRFPLLQERTPRVTR